MTIELLYNPTWWT